MDEKIEKTDTLRTDRQKDSFEVNQARNNIYLYGVSISPPIPSLYTPEGWRPFSHRYEPQININEKDQEEEEEELDIIDPRNENLKHLQEDTLSYQKFKKGMKNLICFIDPQGLISTHQMARENNPIFSHPPTLELEWDWGLQNKKNKLSFHPRLSKPTSIKTMFVG